MQLQGKFIVIEGIDGCGKSTLIKKLKSALGDRVVLTQEPGGSSLGKFLRDILQYQTVKTCDKAEFLLFAADRAQHYTQLILPSLEQSKIVISDRWADSSIVYQGYGRGLDIDMIKTINQWITNNLKPTLTVYLKIDIDEMFARIIKRNEQVTVFENEKINFWNKVIHGYNELYKNRNDVAILDGKLSPDNLLAATLKVINEKIN